MLGIGGSLQNPSQHQPPSYKHMKNVRQILSLDPEMHKEVCDDETSPKKQNNFKRKRDDSTYTTKEEKQKTGPMSLAEVIINGKSKLQNETTRNGITFAFMGSSGCGKSSVIRKVFIEQIFGKEATKKRKEKEFIIEIFTESSKSDAFKELDSDVIVDDKGLDQDNINFCYHMNEKYDKQYNFFLMLDDVIDVNYKNLVRKMFLTMRNTNISSLLSLQYPNLIPKSIRTSVYFSLCFNFNNLEAVELIVRGWLSNYLPGLNMKEKIQSYLEWTRGADGHRMFLIDNLNHKVYKVDENYMCLEIQPSSSTNDSYLKKYKPLKDMEEDKSDPLLQ